MPMSPCPTIEATKQPCDITMWYHELQRMDFRAINRAHPRLRYYLTSRYKQNTPTRFQTTKSVIFRYKLRGPSLLFHNEMHIHEQSRRQTLGSCALFKAKTRIRFEMQRPRSSPATHFHVLTYLSHLERKRCSSCRALLGFHEISNE